MVRTNQGGSILGFVIIGAVMAFLLIGGAYFVRHNLAPTSEEVPVTVDNGSTSETSTEENTTVDQGENTNSQPSEGGSVEQPGSESTAPTTPSEPTHTDTSNQTVTENSSTDNLPQTGPGDMLIAGLLLASVVGVLAAYLRSRALSVSL